MSENQISLQESPAIRLQNAGASKWPPIEIDKVLSAIERIQKAFSPETAAYPVSALQPGRILAETITRTKLVPNNRTSTKNGYACCASDGDIIRKVVGVSTPEVTYSLTVRKGECVKLTTGAFIPDGADAVVELDNATIMKSDDPTAVLVKFAVTPSFGQNIRQPDSEMTSNELILDFGCELNAPEIGVLNSLGMQTVELFMKPNVCVMSIGNKLVESNVQNVPSGFHRDSNRPQLMALFRQQGFRPIDAGLHNNRADEIEEGIREAARFATVIVTSGGANQFESDFLKDVLEKRLQLTVQFGRVWMKQGTHCGFAHGYINTTPVVIFALPGYSPDTFTCAHLFVSPFLRGLAGRSKTKSTILKVKVAENLEMDDCPSYLRAWLERRPGEDLPIANITGTQISSRLQSLVAAEVLLILPSKHQKQTVSIGEVVDAMVISAL